MGRRRKPDVELKRLVVHHHGLLVELEVHLADRRVVRRTIHQGDALTINMGAQGGASVDQLVAQNPAPLGPPPRPPAPPTPPLG